MNSPSDEILASELAEALDDRESLSLYVSYARTYPAPLLKRALAEALSVPVEKIRKSRGALFTYLVRKYANKNTNDRWN
jgi:DNA replicative helicase MCM subunit Mcm2 (Cdc46/Mcm family)